MNTIENSPAPGVLPRLGGKITNLSQKLGYARPRSFYIEIAIVLAVGVAAAAFAVHQFRQFEFVRVCRGFDLWFDSDPGRTVANITSRWSLFHNRSTLHPLYALFVAGPFSLLKQLGLSTSAEAAVYVAVQSASYAILAYVALRAFALARLDALLGVALLYSTAASIYWIGFPEWVAFGAASVLIPVIWIAGPAALRNRATGFAQNLASASIGLTSWAIGAGASLVSDWPKLRWGQAFANTRDALACMAVLYVAEYLIFPNSGAFLKIWDETHVAMQPGEGHRGLLAHAVEFFAQTLIAPSMSVHEGARTVPGWGILIMQSQGLGVPLTPVTILILLLWAGLLGLGLYAALRGAVRAGAALLVIGALGYYFVLHFALGGEIFLFSLHFAPFLVFIAMWALRTRYALAARIACIALILASAAHNYPAFTSAAAIHNAIDPSWLTREDVASQEVAKTDCR
jgi:hypothetical protein